jgi:hypothetical protein
MATRIPELSMNLKPPEIALQCYRLIQVIRVIAILSVNKRHEANEAALKLYPYLKETVSGAKDPLLSPANWRFPGTL